MPPGCPRAQLERLTPATVTDRLVLDGQLQQIRAQGFAVVVDELEPNLAAVAAPVYDAGGAVMAAISISGPDHRLPQARLLELGGIIVREAGSLSIRLGHEGTTQGAA